MDLLPLPERETADTYQETDEPNLDDYREPASKSEDRRLMFQASGRLPRNIRSTIAARQAKQAAEESPT